MIATATLLQIKPEVKAKVIPPPTFANQPTTFKFSDASMELEIERLKKKAIPKKPISKVAAASKKIEIVASAKSTTEVEENTTFRKIKSIIKNEWPKLRNAHT